jgi:uncharacterized protein YndB with AHSA1/START domain
MLANTENAVLVIADISGYTAYLAGVELDHAHDILADLTDTVIGSLRPAFRLSKLEGDAVFAYRVTDEVDLSALQDTIEGCYFAFRRRLRDIGQASQCPCDACQRIPSLDLKAVVHVGAIARQRMAGREELVGRDVIVVHRLLKNTVQDELGPRAYALYTAACFAGSGVDPSTMGLRSHRETYDVIGEVAGYIRDLEAAWTDELDRAREIVGDDNAVRAYGGEVAAPPQVVWELMTSPERRPQWGPGIDRIDEASPAGRRGAGTTNHCVHGKDAIVEEILDWRPYEYWTTRTTLPIPGAPKLVMTDLLTPTPTGTRIDVRLAGVPPRHRAALDAILPMLDQMFAASQAGLLAAVDEEMARRATAGANEPAEPSPPVSGGRHLDQPVAVAAQAVDSGAGHSSS